MTADQLLGYIKDYGPAVMSFIGTVLMAIFTVILGVLRSIWRKEQDEKLQIKAMIEALANEFESLKIRNFQEYGKINENVQSLRAELTIHIRSNEHVTRSIASVEGVVKAQQDVIYSQVQSIVKVEGKLDSIFRFIDAPKRSTDSSS